MSRKLLSLITLVFLILTVLTIESNFRTGECHFFNRKKEASLGRKLTEQESQAFELYWHAVQKNPYFRDSLYEKDPMLSNQDKKFRTIDLKSSKKIGKQARTVSEKAISIKRKELKSLFKKYLALKILYGRKRKYKNTVLKKWALVRFELKLSLPRMSEVMKENDRALGINSDIFHRVGFIDNWDTKKLIPYIKPLRRRL